MSSTYKPYYVNPSAFTNTSADYKRYNQALDYANMDQESIKNNPYAAQESESLGVLRNQMLGNGPNPAALQAQQMAQQAGKQALSYAQSQGGHRIGQNLQSGLNAQSQLMQQGQSTAALAQLQQQLGSQSLYNQALQGAQGAYGNRMAQYLNQNQFLLGQYGQQSSQSLQAQIAQQQLQAQAYEAAQANQAQQAIANQQYNQAILGGVSGLAGAGIVATGLAMSDENSKKNIESGDRTLEDFLNKLRAHEYEYKDQNYGSGKFISPMAQELEKTNTGRSMVVNTPSGKMVDYGRGFGTMLAATANLHERVKALEAMRGKT